MKLLLRLALIALLLVCFSFGGARAAAHPAPVERVTAIHYQDFSAAPSRTSWLLLPDGQVFRTFSIRKTFSDTPKIERYQGRCDSELFRRAAALLQSNRFFDWPDEPLDLANGSPNELGILRVTTNRHSATAQVLNFDDGTRDATSPSAHMQRLKTLQTLQSLLHCANLRRMKSR